MTETSFPERELIPYEATTFSAGRAAVLAAHPDDEVLGCGAALASLAASGAELHVLLLTDGAGLESDPEARRGVAGRRREESRRALEILGGARIHTAEIPDREVGRRRRDVEAELGRFLQEVRPELVFAPSPVEIHPDHSALAAAFLALLRDGAVSIETVAFYEISQAIRPNFLLDATPYRALKNAAMDAFVSQNATRDYAGFIRGLNAYRRMTLPPSVEAAEGFYVLPGAALRRLDTTALARAMGPSPPAPRRSWSALAASLMGKPR